MRPCSSGFRPRRSAATIGALCCLALAPGLSAQAPRDYTGLSSADIVLTETELLQTYALAMAPQCGDRAAALETVTTLVAEREMIVASIHRVFPVDQVEGIGATDAIDDSLTRSFDLIARAYEAAAGPASYPDTSGALELFRERIASSPGVGEIPVPFATVAAVRYGRDALAAARASGHNEPAAEDAFLRYVARLTRSFMDARTTLRKRHLADIQNEDWVLARLRCSECGAQDWDIGALFMKIKRGTSNYHHSRELACRKCGSVITWDHFLPSFTLMNKLGAIGLPGEPPDSGGVQETEPAVPASTH